MVKMTEKCPKCGNSMGGFIKCENPECPNNQRFIKVNPEVEKETIREEIKILNNKINEITGLFNNYYSQFNEFSKSHDTNSEEFKNRISEIQKRTEWNERRMGAFEVLIGVALAFYIPFAESSTDIIAWAGISILIGIGSVLILIGFLRKGTMWFMDVLTLDWKGRKKRK